MDDLHQLYEHQTMMAFGIYSLLDNFLSNIPPSSGLPTQVDGETVDYPSPTLDEENRQIRPIVNRLSTSGIFQFQSGETFEDELDHIRTSTRVAQETTNGSLTTPIPSASRQDSPQLVRQLNEVEEEEVKKLNVAPGGYAENMFIYISELEKEEYMCAICYGILKEAHQCTNGHKFCFGCIYTWSTGDDLSHDSCPACRCDGLYAKNTEIINRISRKKVRCLNVDCNWLGSLHDYERHNHRRYTTHELDLILSNGKKITTETFHRQKSGSSLRDNQDCNEENKAREALPGSVTQRTPSTIFSTQCLSSASDTCGPLTFSLSENGAQGSDGPPVGSQGRQSLTRRGSECNTETNQSTHRVRFRGNGLPSQTVVASPCVGSHRVNSHRTTDCPTEPEHQNFQNVRTSPVTFTTTNRTEGRMLATTFTGQVGNHWSRVEHGLLDSPIPEETNRSECPTGMSDSAVTLTYSTSGIERLGIRTDNLDYTPSNSATQTSTTTASDAYLTTRQRLFSPDTPTIEQNTPSAGGYPISVGGGRTNCVCLPEINPGSRLTGGQLANLAPSYNSHRTCRPLQAVQEGNPDTPSQCSSGSNELDSLTGPTRMEFRRLAPRRPDRVVEQLRETRERLAAMLQLMTIELEERRQHVINATLATAARTNRLMQTLTAAHSVMPTTEREDRGSPLGDCSQFCLTQRRTVPNSTVRDQTGMSRSLYLLRTLPVPERRGGQSPLPFGRLDRLLYDQRIGRISQPGRTPGHQDGSQQPTVYNNRNLDWTGARLLSRGRQTCGDRQPTPARSPAPTLRLITNRCCPDRVAMSFAQPVRPSVTDGYSSSSSGDSDETSDDTEV